MSDNYVDPLGLNRKLDDLDEVEGDEPEVRAGREAHGAREGFVAPIDAANADAPPGGERRGALPDHEYDDSRTVGGGVMSGGGTAIDRGTGTLEGQAQGAGTGDDVQEIE